MVCVAAACPNALRPVRYWQSPITSFFFPRNADLRNYLLQTTTVFQCFPSMLGAAGPARGRGDTLPHGQGSPVPSVPGDTHCGGCEGADGPRTPSPPSLARQIPASPLPKHHFFPSILCPLFVSQWDIWGQSSLAAPVCSSPHVAPTPSAHWDAAGPQSSVTSWGSPITPHPPCCLSLHFSQLWHPPSAP